MEASLCRSRRGYCIGRVSSKEMQGLGVAERVYMSHISIIPCDLICGTGALWTGSKEIANSVRINIPR